MLLAAVRTGCDAGLRTELEESQPRCPRSSARHPDKLPKAQRWVGEMREIAAFNGPDDSATRFIAAAVNLFATMGQNR